MTMQNCLPLIGDALIGDANEDWDITEDDAILIIEFAVGVSPLSPWQKFLSDVDRDGDVTVDDAMIIMQYLMGIYP